MEWIWKSLAGGTVSYFWSTWIMPALLPAIAAMTAALLGITSATPMQPMYVWLGALTAFALTTIGLLRLDEWRERVRVEDKIAFNAANVGISVQPGQIALGFEVISSANFKIECEVIELKTRIQDRVPAKVFPLPTIIEIPPRGVGFLVDEYIALNDPNPKNVSMQGIVDFKMRYGRPGNRKFLMHAKKSVTLPFDNSGNLLQGGLVCDLK